MTEQEKRNVKPDGGNALPRERERDRPSQQLRPTSSHFRHTLEYFRQIEVERARNNLRDHDSSHSHHSHPQRHTEGHPPLGYPRQQAVYGEDEETATPAERNPFTAPVTLAQEEENEGEERMSSRENREMESGIAQTSSFDAHDNDHNNNNTHTHTLTLSSSESFRPRPAQKTVSFLLTEEDEQHRGVRLNGVPSFFFSSSSEDTERMHSPERTTIRQSDGTKAVQNPSFISIDSEFEIPRIPHAPESVDERESSKDAGQKILREEMMQRMMTEASMQSSASVRTLRAPLLAKKKPPMQSAPSTTWASAIPSYAVTYDAHGAQKLGKKSPSRRNLRNSMEKSLSMNKSISFHIISSPADEAKDRASRHHYHRPDHILRNFPHNRPAYRGVYAQVKQPKDGPKEQSLSEMEAGGEPDLDILLSSASASPKSSAAAKKNDGSPSNKFIYEFDLTIVFPIDVEQHQGQSTDAKFIMHTMLRAGLEIYPFLSDKHDMLFVLIRAPLQILKNFAEKTNLKLLANEDVLSEILAHGNPEKRIAPVRIKHEPKITPIRPCEFVYLRYQEENRADLYEKAPNEEHPFSKLLRLKLMYHMLSAPKRLGGCNLGITALLHQRKILSIFPLHYPEESRKLLARFWDWRTMPWNTPNEDLKEYLGEKITIFYVFLGHFSLCLLPIAAVGIVGQVLVFYTDNFSHPSLVIYSAIIIIWSIWMLTKWKLKQSTYALRWGMTDFVDQQYERPEFFGELHMNSFIDGREMLYFSRKDFRRRAARSLATILSLLLLVLGVISAIYILKFALQRDLGLFVSGVASILNVLQIMLFNLVYQKIAVHLTDQENHRTDTQYENALILKVFVSQFINSYASLFFLAFVAAYLPRPAITDPSQSNHLGQCGDTTCMRPMAITLATIIISRAIPKNAFDVILPYCKVLYLVHSETGTLSVEKLSPPEQQFFLMEHDPTLESVKTFADVAVQYGYTVLFAAALPMAPLLTLLYNHIKMKTQLWKVLEFLKRPVPDGAQGIESWQLIFTLISIIAVVTNAAIICFTMTALNPELEANARIWIFVLFQWTMLFLQYMMSILIPEESEYVQIQLSRISAITQKVIDKFEDEDYDTRLINEIASEDENDAAEDPLITNGAIVGIPRTNGVSHNVDSPQSTGLTPQWPERYDGSSKGNSARRSYWSSLNSMISSIGSSMDEMDIENQTQNLSKTPVSPGLKRAQSFYAGSKESHQWWRDISTILGSPSVEKLSRKISGQSEAASKREKKMPKKKKVYRRRVLNPAMEALNLSALPLFEYPLTDQIKAWNPPLTQEGVGDESDFDILDLEIW